RRPLPRHDLRQLDEGHGRRLGHGRPLRQGQFHHDGALGHILELQPPDDRLQHGEDQADGRRWALVLLRGELTGALDQADVAGVAGLAAACDASPRRRKKSRMRLRMVRSSARTSSASPKRFNAVSLAFWRKAIMADTRSTSGGLCWKMDAIVSLRTSKVT